MKNLKRDALEELDLSDDKVLDYLDVLCRIAKDENDTIEYRDKALESLCYIYGHIGILLDSIERH